MAQQEFRKVFDQGGTGDSLWIIERDRQGRLYLTNNAMTRERVSRRMYAGWTLEMLARLKQGLIQARVGKRIVTAFMKQIQSD